MIKAVFVILLAVSLFYGFSLYAVSDNIEQIGSDQASYHEMLNGI